MRNRRAFTLVEMMIVLLIGAMAAALVVPVVGRTPASVAINRTTVELQKAFATASRRSRATGETVTLKIDFANGAVRVEGGGPVRGDEGGEGEQVFETKLPGGVKWERDQDDGATYTFLPDGRAYGPQPRFVLRKRQFDVVLDNLTGRVFLRGEDD
jgi:prepilin-type N-terminal cleavage/methylation domain-containing protein